MRYFGAPFGADLEPNLESSGEAPEADLGSLRGIISGAISDALPEPVGDTPPPDPQKHEAELTTAMAKLHTEAADPPSPKSAPQRPHTS